MEYKLAKQLKEAGFSQDTEHYYTLACLDTQVISAIDEYRGDQDWFTPNLEKDIACPTLSELIEACGDEFRALRLDSSMKTENNEQWACDRVEHGVFETFIGKTPEEAVARLYIKLNKK